MEAQNLVPNGSFEEFSYCPDYWNQLGGNVIGWNVCSPSPDYFNRCRDSTDFGIPFNWRGYQEAGDGDGYIGVGTYQVGFPFFREFACAPLMQPLVAGVPVFLSMKVALGGFGSYSIMSPKWTCNGIGMRLTTQPFEWPLAYHPNTAQLYLDEVLNDTTDWTTLSTIFIPDSAYSFVTVGNFFEDSFSDPTLLDTLGGTSIAYFFIDRVCITTDPAGCLNYSGEIEFESVPEWSVASVFTNKLDVMFRKSLMQACFLELWDIAGCQVSSAFVTAGEGRVSLQTAGLADGLYVLSIRGQNGASGCIRVFHVSP